MEQYNSMLLVLSFPQDTNQCVQVHRRVHHIERKQDKNNITIVGGLIAHPSTSLFSNSKLMDEGYEGVHNILV